MTIADGRSTWQRDGRDPRRSDPGVAHFGSSLCCHSSVFSESRALAYGLLRAGNVPAPRFSFSPRSTDDFQQLPYENGRHGVGGNSGPSDLGDARDRTRARVWGDIRASLVPAQVRDAIKRASDEGLEERENRLRRTENSQPLKLNRELDESSIENSTKNGIDVIPPSQSPMTRTQMGRNTVVRSMHGPSRAGSGRRAAMLLFLATAWIAARRSSNTTTETKTTTQKVRAADPSDAGS